MAACETATQNTYVDAEGRVYEVFGLDGQFVFENQIRNQASQTREHPGWILADDDYCQWQGPPPKRFWETSLPVIPDSHTSAIRQQTISASGHTGGAFLILVGLACAAVYAIYQFKNGKSDEELLADNYHPMSDIPALPGVYTDEALDVVYDRIGRPQYQDVTEPNPWRSPRDDPRPSPDIRTAEPVHEPVVQRFSEPVRELVQPSGSAACDAFEFEVLPPPNGGYYLSEESLLNKGTAYQLVWTALDLGYSKNWIGETLFKVQKGANQKYKLFCQLYKKVREDLNL